MRIEPRAGSHTVDYYFPAIRIFVTAIPKNGSQSVLAYLTALESCAQGSLAELPASFDQAFEQIAQYAVSPELEVHTGDESTLTIALVREPYARISSCWIDKFLGWSPGVTMRHSSAPWFPSEVHDRASLQAAFVRFLEALAGDSELLHADAHWTPQTNLLRPLGYDHQCEPDELTRLLPPIVETHVSEGTSIPRAEAVLRHVRSGLVLERRNASPPLLRQLLEGDPAARLLIRRIYSDDYRINPEWDRPGATFAAGSRDESPEVNEQISRNIEHARLVHFQRVCELDTRLTRATEELAAARLLALQSDTERDNALLVRDAALQERDNALLVRDAALQERDNALLVRDAALQERDNALLVRDAALQERDNSS